MTRTARRRFTAVSLLMISAVLLAVISPAAFADGTQKLSGNFTYVSNSTGITIVKIKSSGDTVEIPSSLDDKVVTAVASDAFKSLGVKKVVLPATVTDVGDGNVLTANSIFASSIEEIVVDSENPVYQSADGALYRDGMTTVVYWPRTKAGASIQIPESVTKIAPYAFAANKNITTLSFSGASTAISDGAFSGCTSLTSVTLPAALTSIGSQAFKGCTSLTTISIPSTVTEIGSGAFAGCNKLTTINSAAQLSDDAMASLAGASKNLTVYLPDGTSWVTDSSGSLVKSGAPAMPTYEETTAPETTAEITTPIQTTAESTTEETTTEETSADTTEEMTVTIAPPETMIDPSIGVEQTDGPEFAENTTEAEREPVTERTPETDAPAAVIETTATTTDYETVYFIEPKPSVFEQISADLTLVWILGGVAVVCAVAAAIYLIVTRRSRVTPSQNEYFEAGTDEFTQTNIVPAASDDGSSDREYAARPLSRTGQTDKQQVRHSKYYDR